MSTTSDARLSAHGRRPAQPEPRRTGPPQVVPFIARWSGEQNLPIPVIARRGQRSGIAYADRRAFDRSARVPWVLASQLIMRISDFTVVNLTGQPR